MGTSLGQTSFKMQRERERNVNLPHFPRNPIYRCRCLFWVPFVEHPFRHLSFFFVAWERTFFVCSLPPLQKKKSPLWYDLLCHLVTVIIPRGEGRFGGVEVLCCTDCTSFLLHTLSVLSFFEKGTLIQSQIFILFWKDL